MSKTKTKRYLVLLAAIGLVAAALGSTGTFATFNAEVTNSGNTFATGTLLLSDSVHSANTCFSDTAANNSESASCSAIINTSNLFTNHTSFQRLTITNTGSLDSSDLLLWGSTCANSTVGTFDAGATLAHTGDVCGQLLFSVEQHSSDASDAGSAVACVIGTPSGNTCDPSAGTPLGAWLSAHGSSANAFTFSGDSLTAGASRYYTVYIHLPDEDNTFQGRAAAFDLTWHIDQ